MSKPPDGSTVSRLAPARLARPVVRAWLRVVYPPELEAETELGAKPIIVGREPGAKAGLALGHGTVSRRHLAVAWDAGQALHVAADLGSRNGSAVDGEPVGREPRPLGDGAVVRLGDVLLVYESGPGIGVADPPEVSREAVPGRAAAMRVVRAALARAAPDRAPVLLVGETGTGKEWMAGELHRLSGRAGKLVAVNCAALSPQLVESQLFGHVRGAFTGATETQPGLFRAAHGGSLFLDEVGELPLELQPKLLRVVQEAEVQPVGSVQGTRVDVRIIAATHRDLAQVAEAGQFRRDLYARLSLWEIRVPPLRARRVDLLDWIATLGRKWQSERGAEAVPPCFDPDAAEVVLTHSWPFNLRALDRLVRELGPLAAGGRPIGAAELPSWLEQPTEAPPPATRRPAPSREEFAAAFADLKGSVRALSRHFERDRRQIYRWIEAYGLRPER